MIITKKQENKNSFEKYEQTILQTINQKLKTHFKTLENLTETTIHKHEKKLNLYPNFEHLQNITDKDLFTLDETKIDTKQAEASILKGEIFWEHTAAGEATRLGLGTKYLLNPTKFTTNEIIQQIQKEEIKEILKTSKTQEEQIQKISDLQTNFNPEKLKKTFNYTEKNLENLNSISLGNRHMLQLSFDLTKLAKKHNLDPTQILNNQKNLIILNEETSETILQEFINWNFFGFNPTNTYFMIQKKLHGIHIKNNQLEINKHEKNKRLHNHGQMLIQKTYDNEIFQINPINPAQKTHLQSNQFETILENQKNLISFNIEDLGYLTSSLDLPSIALALKLGQENFGMVMEIVLNNPIKPQKGGACFFDQKLKKIVMIESNQLGNIKNHEINHLNKNFNHYPNPSEIFKKIKTHGLPISFEIKNFKNENNETIHNIYPCPVQGDSNFLTKTAFVKRKTLKPIKNWKSPATTPLAIQSIINQENQPNFTKFINHIKTLNNNK